MLGAGRARARSVLFNEDEVKHAGQQQSKKHTQSKLGWPDRANEVDERSPVQHTQRSVPSPGRQEGTSAPRGGRRKFEFRSLHIEAFL